MKKLEKDVVTYVFLNDKTRFVKDGLIGYEQELIIAGELEIFIDGGFTTIGNKEFRYSIKTSLIDVIQVEYNKKPCNN